MMDEKTVNELRRQPGLSQEVLARRLGHCHWRETLAESIGMPTPLGLRRIAERGKIDKEMSDEPV